MTDARKEAIERVAKDTEMLPGSVDHWAHHPQYGDEKLRSAVDGWQRAIVRGRLLRELDDEFARYAAVIISPNSFDRDALLEDVLRKRAEIRAELEGQDGK